HARVFEGARYWQWLLDSCVIRSVRTNDRKLTLADEKCVARSRGRAARDDDSIASDRICRTEIVNARAALFDAQARVAFRDGLMAEAYVCGKAPPNQVRSLAGEASMERWLARNRQAHI